MKKVLSVLLAALMCVSMLAVTAFAAPEGTAITTAAEFYAITGNGNYYLANDITINSSCCNVFSGTFDGNGKTITTTYPLFHEVGNATIKNLTVEGNIALNVSNIGVIVDRVSYSVCGDTILENIVNNADILSSSGSCGGMVGRYYGVVGGAPCSLTIRNCVNNGNVTTTSEHAGGFLAYRDDTCLNSSSTLIIENCTNNGDVKSFSTNAKYGKSAGGIVGSVSNGRASNKDPYVSLIKITGCVNTGDILTKCCYAAYGGTAGIVGAVAGEVEISNCKNTGSVTAESSACASGIVGTTRYDTTTLTISKCDNYGVVSGFGKIGEILANTDKAPTATTSYTITDCYTANAGAAIYGGTAGRVTSSGTPAAVPQYTAPEPNPGTGDTTVMFVSAAIVAVVASAVVIRKKKEEQF